MSGDFINNLSDPRLPPSVRLSPHDMRRRNPVGDESVVGPASFFDTVRRFGSAIAGFVHIRENPMGSPELPGHSAAAQMDITDQPVQIIETPQQT